MKSTLYPYNPLPMGENSRELMLGYYKLPRGLVIVLALLALLVVGLLATTITFASQAYSPACKDGRKAEQECRNLTDSLKNQLTQTQEILLKTEAQAATDNQTAVALMASLKAQQAQGRELQKQVQELQNEIKTLKQKLQDTTQKLQDTTAELNQLRKDHESSTNSGNTLSLSVVAVLLTLSLLDLLA